MTVMSNAPLTRYLSGIDSAALRLQIVHPFRRG